LIWTTPCARVGALPMYRSSDGYRLTDISGTIAVVLTGTNGTAPSGSCGVIAPRPVAKIEISCPVSGVPTAKTLHVEGALSRGLRRLPL
jgi:hypothetical protein